MEEGRPFQWRADASYLITGGLGSLGLRVARWMVDQGARRLILMARTPLPPRAEWTALDPGSAEGQKVAAIRALEGMGASVHLAPVDIGRHRSFPPSWRVTGARAGRRFAGQSTQPASSTFAC